MADAWAIDPCEETYLSVEKLIHHLVWKFCRRFQFDLDEAFSACNLAYMRAYESYDGSTKFSTWVAHKAWKYMQSALNRKRLQDRRKAITDIDLDLLMGKPVPDFSLEDYIEGMSDEARAVVNLVMRPPKSVKKILKQFGEETDINLRMAVKEVLKRNNWSDEKIKCVFREVRNGNPCY
jgi:DNA-directed RNA polymerase specialized sigma24 family protein